MKTHILKQVLFFSLICVVFSCGKKSSNVPVNNSSINPAAIGKLHYLILDNISSSFDTIEFLYDNSGQVSSFYWRYGETNTKAVYSLTRNSSGQITKYSYQEPSYNYKQTYDYTINNLGKFTSANITITNGNHTTTAAEAYTYSGKQLTIEKSQSGNITSTIVVTFDSKGNCIKKEQYNSSGSLDSKTELTFATTENPSGLPGAPSPLSYALTFTPSNFLTSTTTSTSGIETITASYSYDNTGKPISAIYTGAVEGGTKHIQYKYY
jgi:hypothetical protein